MGMLIVMYVDLPIIAITAVGLCVFGLKDYNPTPTESYLQGIYFQGTGVANRNYTQPYPFKDDKT